MIELLGQDDDSEAFIGTAQELLNGLLQDRVAEDVYVVKIDNWFSARWLRFSGKTLGAVGWRKPRLTLPPFVPSRVVHETHYEALGDLRYKMRRPRWSVQRYQLSVDNLTRYVD